MLNPIYKFKRSILHLNRSLHHCNSIELLSICCTYQSTGDRMYIVQYSILHVPSICCTSFCRSLVFVALHSAGPLVFVALIEALVIEHTLVIIQTQSNTVQHSILQIMPKM